MAVPAEENGSETERFSEDLKTDRKCLDDNSSKVRLYRLFCDSQATVLVLVALLSASKSVQVVHLD